MARCGALIALEGIDGAGTSTQAQRLVERMRAEGLPVHGTAEPSGGPVGALLRQVLARRHELDGSVVALLFAADRLDHLRREVEPQLQRGTHVVSDRYLMSSLAYQAGEAEVSFVRAANAWARRPDLTVFLEVDVATALGRRAAAARPAERYDDGRRQREIADRYRSLVRSGAAGAAAVVDGTAGPEVVHAQVWEAVRRLL